MQGGLKIIALVTDAFGGYGGIAQYNRDLFRALADSPVVERVLALPRVAADEPKLWPQKFIQSAPRLSRLSYSLNAVATARAEGPFDVIFCGHVFHAPLAMALRRMFHAKVWLQTHGVDAWDCPSRLVRAAVDHAQLVTAVSRYTRRRMLRWTNLSPDSIRVLPNTVRPIFSPGPRSEATLAKIGLSGAKVILTISRLEKPDAYKGHDRVIEAMVELRRVEPRAVYVVVGEGKARPELEALAARRGIADAVRFLGRLGDADVVALCRSADVLVMPSTKEGFGIVFVEAAATGLPVIAGNLDGSVDALADGAIGQLIDPGSRDAITYAILNALRGRALLTPKAAGRFAYGNFAEHVDNLVRTLAD